MKKKSKKSVDKSKLQCYNINIRVKKERTKKMKTYHIDNIKGIIDKNIDKITEIKITSVKDVDYNSMVGYTYVANVKLTLINGRYRMFKTMFNSTYLEDEHETARDYVEDYLINL